MKGVSIKCPNCAAQLGVKADQDDATCTYCGTSVQVRRRSKILERPLPPPTPVPGRRVVTQQRSAAPAIIIVVILLATLIPLGVGVKACATKTGIISNSSDWEWDGVDAVILTDINGDGVLDALGRVRKLQPEDILAAGAYDGKTGKKLWTSEKLGLRGDILHTVSGLAPGLLMMGGPAGELVGISSADGSVRWRIRLAEKIDRVCEGTAPGNVVVVTADKRAQVIALADGRVEGPAPDDTCKPLPTDDADEASADRDIWAWHGPHAEQVPRELEGMRVDEALHHPQSGVTIALGTKQPGTGIPMIARVTSATDATWIAMVPGGDPLAAPTGSAEADNTAVDGDGVAVAYNVKFAHGYRVAYFAASDGRRLWDAEMDSDMPLSSVRMSPTHVFVSRWDGLYAFDRATGKRAYTIK